MDKSTQTHNAVPFDNKNKRDIDSSSNNLREKKICIYSYVKETKSRRVWWLVMVCNLSGQEADAEGSGVQSQSGLLETCFKKIKNKQNKSNRLWVVKKKKL